ncbi:bicyclomycin resistance protein [Pseudomassariella vexata]|uniref:Bicyclomycin resistance protein n=1 Tax=Pseudomassariella vexata TaxID=1141098 RepID=A0A1Y2E622_9PEZI|nr:bicyclomycin resistance protein [Pseudomassariella vexata]ORY67008.1 bicyclomycin resistance protein [Pseudomassariella vexata]
MASSSTATAAHDIDTLRQLERKISQAFDEGHDADIPSSEGYILDDRGQRKRARSIAEVRRKSEAHSMDGEAADRDVEKAPGAHGGGMPLSNDDIDGNDDLNVISMGPTDPEHPYQWPRWRTFMNAFLISAMSFLTPLASSIFAPGVPQLLREFQNPSLEIAAFVVSVYILGFAFGPLIMAPASEMYGRLVVYHISNVSFLAFVIACALAPNMNTLIVFRFLSGVFGSTAITNGGGSIADLFPQERRAVAMAGFAVGPLLGPIIGPVTGGFLADAEGWRWNFWVLAIATGFLSIVMLFILKESYVPVLLERKVRRLRKETGNNLLRSNLDIGLSTSDYFKRGLVRPVKMLLLSPIIMLTSLFMAVTYGYLYVMFTSMTEVFQQYYGFSTSLVGLSFLGLGIGSLVGIFVFSSTSDRYMKRKSAEDDARAGASGTEKEGGMKPEYRLPFLLLGAVLLPIGLFTYGWTAEKHVHWIVPIFGTGIVGVANIVIFMALQMYLVDAFTVYAASALAANTLVRSIAGAVLPLAGLPMYEKLGIGWGNSILAFIALGFAPVAWLIIRYGEVIRKSYPMKNL